MHNITRSQWIDAKVEEFLNSSSPSFTIELYSSEIRRFYNRHPNLNIGKGPAILSNSSKSLRFSCVVTRKSSK